MAQKVSGTNYTTAVGLFLDLGNGGTYVGPHVKHYFTANDAGQAMVFIWKNHSTIVGVEYAYNQVIPGADGLKWNIGVGPQLAFNDDFTDFLLRPQVGLEYKVDGAPIAFGFDWRPAWTLTHGSNF